ncbi:MAG: hypothetical protein AAGN66_26845 [Acidobacteriota bacterium]
MSFKIDGQRKAEAANRIHWLLTFLVLASMAAAVSPSLFAREPSELKGLGGPWRYATSSAGCESNGRVCAEWPTWNGFLVCCIEAHDLGTSTPPSAACDADPVQVLRP